MSVDNPPNRGVMSGFMPDRHLMVDIETCDVIPSAAILQIAAVTFDPRGGSHYPVEKFCTTISEASNRNAGRSFSQGTMEWWEAQSEEARTAAFAGEHDIDTALTKFCRWVNGLRPTCSRVWAKDPDFDVVILRDACDDRGIMWPFKFWESRSCRTAMEMSYPLGDFPRVEVEGALHDAIVDCQKQVKEIQHAYFVLGC